MMPFNVISKRSREMRTVYAVRRTMEGGAEFLIYHFGEWDGKMPSGMSLSFRR